MDPSIWLHTLEIKPRPHYANRSVLTRDFVIDVHLGPRQECSFSQDSAPQLQESH